MDTATVHEHIRRHYHGKGAEAYRLPYTKQFDRLYDRFRAEAKMELTKHDFWLALLAVSWKALALDCAHNVCENLAESGWGALPVQGDDHEDIVCLFDNNASRSPSARDEAFQEAARRLAALGVEELARVAYPEAGEGSGRTRIALFRAGGPWAKLAKLVRRVYREVLSE
jgi:hypothetical protein